MQLILEKYCKNDDDVYIIVGLCKTQGNEHQMYQNKLYIQDKCNQWWLDYSDYNQKEESKLGLAF